MSPLLKLAAFFWRKEKTALLRAIMLSVVVLVAGISLFALSGWFIVAASAAGLAGIGIMFDVFRPSAGVRLLALGRTAARYGERLLTHDATLRALTVLRVQVLRHLTNADFQIVVRLRGAEMLNRMTADIDALDGVAIRLIFPIIAGGITLCLAFVALWLLVDLTVALFVVGTLGAISWGMFVWLGAKTYQDSVEAARALQSLREGTVDHLRGRGVLAFAGVLNKNLSDLIDLDWLARSSKRRVDRLEILSGLGLGVTSSFVSAGALILGCVLVLQGIMEPALAAIGFFATLAIFETVVPLRRGIAELGKMMDSAGRMVRYTDTISYSPMCSEVRMPDEFCCVEVDKLQIVVGARTLLSEPLSFKVSAGETLALSGASGVGKSSVLNVIAGLVEPHGGRVLINGKPVADHSEYALRQKLGYLPQRSALLSGTIRESVTLGRSAQDAEIYTVLKAVQFADVVNEKNGLDFALGESGNGLSGGQKKRLALARVLLRKPDVLLLDEITEGLDAATARAVLFGIRHYLPGAAIILASHRDIEIATADATIYLKPNSEK